MAVLLHCIEGGMSCNTGLRPATHPASEVAEMSLEGASSNYRKLSGLKVKS